jgi:hypothetical protein
MNGEGKLRTKLVRTGNPSYDWYRFNGQVNLSGDVKQKNESMQSCGVAKLGA